MYQSSFDRSAAILVARLAPGGNESDDFPLHIERMITACDEVAADPKTLCILVLFDRGHCLPTPKVRKMVADAIARDTFEPHLAVVTGNPLVRGVITAISWLRKPDFDIRLVPSTQAAIEWLEHQRGESLPRLAEMLSELEGERAAG